MTTKIKCRIASFSDYLSQLQLHEVAGLLKKAHPKAKLDVSAVEPRGIRSSSKKAANSSAAVAALASSLESCDFDAVVVDASHLSPNLPDCLAIGAVTNRMTPYDVIISKNEEIFDELSENSSVIANTVRREAQLLYYRHDLEMVRAKCCPDELIQKVSDGKIDAAILSAADVERLGKQDYVTEVFTNSICVPAAGQGSLVVLVRAKDEHMRKFIGSICDPASLSEVKAEWAFLRALSLDESDPVGVLGSIEGKKIELEGVLALPDGREKIRTVVDGFLGWEEDLGRLLADEIMEAGGREILHELNLL